MTAQHEIPDLGQCPVLDRSMGLTITSKRSRNSWKKKGSFIL